MARRAARNRRSGSPRVWLEANNLEPKMTPFDPMAILDEIQRVVAGYDISRVNLLAGNDQHIEIAASGPSAMQSPELIVPANDDLFSSERLALFQDFEFSVRKQIRCAGSGATRAQDPNRVGKSAAPHSMSITTFIIISIIKSLAMVGVLLTAVPTASGWNARCQRASRIAGARRGWPFGLLQPLADGAKFIFKEDLTERMYISSLHRGADDRNVFAITSISVIRLQLLTLPWAHTSRLPT